MSETRAVFGHSTVYALAAVLNRGAGFLLLPLYTHFLDPSDFGVLGVITITSEVVGAVIGVKLGTAMSRLVFDYADEHARNELVSTAILGLGSISAASSAILALAAMPLATLLLGDPNQGVLLCLGVVGLLLNVVFTLGLQHLIVLQRSKTVLMASTLRSVGYLGLSTLFVAFLGLGVFGALLGILLTNALAAAGLIVPLLVRIGFRFSRAKFISMLGFGLPLLPAQLAELLVRFADRYLLAQFASMASSGVFFLGLRLGSILPLVFTSPFNQIYIVRRFEAHGRNDDDSEAARLFTYFFAILVCGALGLSLLAPQLIALLTFRRPQYLGAAAVIPLLALAEAVRSILLIVELGIFYAKIPRYLTWATLATLLIHVPLTAVMITMLGVVGAAAAVCLSTSFRLVVTCRLARGLNGPRPEWGYLMVILVAGTTAFGVSWAIDLALGSVWGLVGRVLLACLFPLLLLGSPLFSTSERQALRTFVTQRLAGARTAPGVG